MADAPDWDQGLPLGILSTVAGGRDELKAMRGVCQTWKAGFEESVSGIRLIRGGPLLPGIASLAQRFPSLTSLDLGDSLMEEASLGDLSRLNRLVSLILGQREDWCRFVARRLGPPPLAMKLTDSGLKCLSGVPLTRLDLEKCGRLTDAGLEYLIGLPLTGLDMHNAFKITDIGLKSLQSMPLSHLTFEYSVNLTDAGLGFLSGLPLTFLSLRNCPLLTDAGFACLRGLPLTSFTFGHYRGECQITDSGLESLAQMPLKHLDIFNCRYITGAGFIHLRGTPLTSLDLICPRLVNASLVLLCGLPLENLSIRDCGKVTGAALVNLAGMQLTHFELWGCASLRDAELVHLLGMPLRELRLPGCSGLTEAGKKALREAFDVSCLYPPPLPRH